MQLTVFVVSCILSLLVCVSGYYKRGFSLLSEPMYITNFFFILFYHVPILFFYGVFESVVLPIGVGTMSINLGLFLSERVLNKRQSVSGFSGGSFQSRQIPYKFILLIAVVANLAYLSLYVQRGIPFFSGNIDLARAAFIEGSGHISRTSSALMVICTLSLISAGRVRLGFLVLIVSLSVLLLSGWRGYVAAFILPLIIIYSIYGAVKKVHVLVAAGALSLIVILGLIRAAAAGGSLYGINIFESDYLALPMMIGTYLVFRMAEHLVGLSNVIFHFSERHLYGGGLVMDLGALTPGGSYKVSELMKDLYGGWEGGGGMTLTVFGTFYADFGIPGVIILSFISAAIYAFAFYYSLNSIRFLNLGVVLSGVISFGWISSLMGSYVSQFLATMILYSVMAFFVYLSYKVIPKKKRGLVLSSSLKVNLPARDKGSL